MKERPILFSAPMVRALLAGTKTQTRRIVKPQPTKVNPRLAPVAYLYVEGDWAWRSGPCCHTISNKPNGPDGWAKENSPYGVPGDRLWVRETWGYFDPDGIEDGVAADRRGGEAWTPELMQEGHPLRCYWRRRIAYKATFAGDKYGMGPVGPSKWRPSIHMPRWASRITIEVTDVRVERLQEISEQDALGEGVFRPTGMRTPIGHCVETWDGRGEMIYANPSQARDEFRGLWESIHGLDAWRVNPWVWVVCFKRLP